jgi:hypothetical protein
MPRKSKTFLIQEMSPQEFVAARKDVDMNQSEWGRLLGISLSTVRNYSTGRSVIPEKIALRARHFGDVHERCRQLQARMRDLLAQMRDVQAQVRHLERVIDSKEWIYSEKGEAPWRDQHRPQQSA